MVKKILKISGIVVASLLVFILLVAGFTQTQFFRDRLRSAVLSSLDSLLLAEVQLGNLRGNIFSGFSFDHLSLKVDGDLLFVAEQLDVRYNLTGLPGKTASIDKLTLIRPTIRLATNREGVWNFERLVRPSSPDTTTGGPFDWVISVNRFEIQEGLVMLVDSSALLDEHHSVTDSFFVEYHDVALQQFNLVTSLKITPVEKQAVISSLSFVSERPNVRLEHLSGEFSATLTEASVKDLQAQTGVSRLRLDASLSDIDLLGGLDLEALQHKPVSVSLRAHDIDLNELKRFIPEIAFLNGPASLDLDAGGEFGDLDIKTLYLKRGATQLNFSGSVVNLHTPGELFLSVKCTESRVYSPDVLDLMPAFNLPDYRSLGMTTLNLEFTGKPLDFHTKFLLESDAGNVHADAGLIIGDPYTLKYNGRFLTQGLDLAQIMDDPLLASSLNASVQIQGEGVSLDHLRGSVQVVVDSSVLRGQPLTKSRFSIAALDHKLTGTATVSLGTMSGDISGLVDYSSDSSAFSFDGSIHSANLEDLLKDPSLNSDLTMTITADGTGLTWGTLNGDCVIDFTDSRYREYRIRSGRVHVLLDQKDPEHKHLQVESSIADFSLKGAFDLEYGAQLIGYEFQSLRSALREKFVVIDSSFAAPADLAEQKELAAILEKDTRSLNVDYYLNLKDLEPLSIATGNRIFDGVGTLTGNITGDYHTLSINGKLDIDNFFYGSAESGILVQNGMASFDLKNLKPVQPLKDLEARVVGTARSMHINRDEFDSVQVSFTHQQEYSSYTARSTFNRDVLVVLQGLADVSEHQVLFTINELQIGYKDFAWHADGGGSVGFNSHSVNIADLVMRRDSQSVTIRGFLGIDGSINAEIDAKSIDLDVLRYLMAGEDQKSAGFAGHGGFSLHAAGTLEHPVFELAFHAADVSYRTIPFGLVSGMFNYRDERLVVQAEVFDRVGESVPTPKLVITGTLPLNLALVNVEERLPDEQMELTIRSAGVEMSILDPLLPTFNQFSGILKCDVRVRGTPRQPDYRGQIAIEECSFLFVPNNIHYTFAGVFEPDGERIKVIDAVVRNVPADRNYARSEGEIKLSGDFTLREFKPGDFNLTATGRLLVVKETTRKSALSVYGNLFVEIRDGGLHFTGSIERSLLRGKVLVRNSTLIFPPTQATVAQLAETALPIIMIDDTSRAQPKAAHTTAADRYFGSMEDTTLHNNGRQAGLPTKSFLDGVRYDLDIETVGGTTEIQMIFNPATAERLVAGIEGRFFILDDGKRWIGDLTIERAYYYFFKRFDAEGTIRYSGDFLNPELDIEAQYQGTRTTRPAGDTLSTIVERIVVNLKISGTRIEPKLAISMTIDGIDYYSYRGVTSSDVQNDAVAFILTGTFPLSKSEANDVASDLRTTVGTSLFSGAASLLTSSLSEFLRTKTGFIYSVELSYGAQGSFGESADIRVSGTAFNGLWRYGGRILGDPISNANFSLLYSLGDIVNRPSLRNFMFELERRVETGTIGGQTNDIRGINSARMFYRFSF